MQIFGIILSVIGLFGLFLAMAAVALMPTAKFEYQSYVPGMTFCLMGVYFFVSGLKRRFQIRDLFVLVTICAALFGWMRWETSRYSESGKVDLDPQADGTNANEGSPQSSEKLLQRP